MSTRRILMILAPIVILAFLLSQLPGCRSVDRQWRDGQAMLENLPR